jgi:uridylate kinase
MKKMTQDHEKKYVIKVGGSLLFENNQIRVKKIQEFATALQSVSNLAAIVVGGGTMARTYIQAARGFDAGESICDQFGIDVSRLNSRILITALKDAAYPEPIKTLEESRVAALSHKILVVGGFVPGQSTTSVTFQVAEALHATDILVLTNVDGVYDKDPRKFSEAKKFDSISVDKLEEIIYSGEVNQAAAGEYRIFDAVSIQIFKRNQINVRLMNGEKTEEITAVLKSKINEKGIGTQILRQ